MGFILGSNVNECHEGLNRCSTGQCVADLNRCPTSILFQIQIAPTRSSQLQSSSLYTSTSVDIMPTSSMYMSQSSVKETTTSDGSASVHLKSTLLIPTIVIFYVSYVLPIVDSCQNEFIHLFIMYVYRITTSVL